MDANIFNKLKGVDEHSHKIVYGFVHDHNKNIPDLIKVLCLFYFFEETEEFGNHGKHIEIKCHNGIKYGALCLREDDYNTVFGSVQINPKQNPKSIFKWTFEIDDHIESEYNVAIGFTESNELNLNSYAFNSSNPNSYYVWDISTQYKWDHQQFITHSGRIPPMESFYPNPKGKQIIQITFNVPKHTITAQLNGVCLGVLFDNVDTTKSYYLGVSLFCATNPIKIISFTVANQTSL